MQGVIIIIELLEEASTMLEAAENFFYAARLRYYDFLHNRKREVETHFRRSTVFPSEI